ncbi:MAG: endonuclease NucS domain-containing protein [Thermoleophilia bacterium]
MPIEVGIWRMGDKLEKVTFSAIESELKLEDQLAKDISILSADLMLVGRQVMTAFGKFIDLLAMDVDGNLSVIELKKDRTPRDVVAQVLDYASWVQTLSYDDIADIYAEKNGGKELEEGFAEVFGTNPPEKLNQSHQLIVIASELDANTERIINYLSDNYGVPINAVFFRHFQDGSNSYLTRTWLIDPNEVEVKASKSVAQRGGEVWNGKDFYVSFGDGEHRNWEDGRRYGFVSAGQGKWYSRTMEQLLPGARIFAMIPSIGYVGVGFVTETVVPVNEFKVEIDGKVIPILSAPINAPNMSENSDNPELSEYVVRVEWQETVGKDEAYWEKGLFANQNSVCRLKNRFTLENLKKFFKLED